MTERVFISYRRSDAEATAARIADRLRAHFGEGEVFFDAEAIDPGVPWRPRIDTALASARVQVVVVGPGWLTAKDEQGRLRLGRDDDIVTHEVGQALARGIPVLPVRVQGAPIPDAQQLPSALRGLFGFNDSEVRPGAAFERDVAALTASVAKRLDSGLAGTARQRRGLALGGAAVAGAALLAALGWWARSPSADGADSGPSPATGPAGAAGAVGPGPGFAAASASGKVPSTLLITMRLGDATPGTPGSGGAPGAVGPGTPPPMRLYHRLPAKGTAPNINLLEQAVAVGDGALEYRSPLPLMPAAAQQYQGILHRAVTSGEHARQTQVCFVATPGPTRDEDMVRLDCREGQQCQVSPQDVGWARDCPPPGATPGPDAAPGAKPGPDALPGPAPTTAPGAAPPRTSGLPSPTAPLQALAWRLLPAAMAAPGGPSSAAGRATGPNAAPAATATASPDAASTPQPWAVPSLQTLRNSRYGERAFSEVRLQTGPWPAAQGADRVLWAVRINGNPLWVDGLPADAWPQPFDAAKGLDLAFGLENLDASGIDQGHERLEITLRFMAGTREVLQDRVNLRYVALRPITPRTVRTATGQALQWQAEYHVGRRDDAYQVIIDSTPTDAGWLAKRKRRIDDAHLRVALDGQGTLPLVAVQRPPWRDNPNHALNAGITLPNGQVRFSFDEATARQVCRTLSQQAQRQPQLLRADTYRRSLDNRGKTRPCATL